MTQQEDFGAYADYTQAQDDGNALAELSLLADRQAEAALRVAELEKQLEEARGRLRGISDRQLPEKMDELGMEEFKTRSGLHIRIKEAIRTSIPKTRQAEAFEWLRQNGYGGLIKRIVAVKFGKGEDEVAEKLARDLARDLANGREVDDTASVHPSTLLSFVTEQLANGVDLPLDLFGVHRQRTSVID